MHNKNITNSKIKNHINIEIEKLPHIAEHWTETETRRELIRSFDLNRRNLKMRNGKRISEKGLERKNRICENSDYR